MDHNPSYYRIAIERAVLRAGAAARQSLAPERAVAFAEELLRRPGLGVKAFLRETPEARRPEVVEALAERCSAFFHEDEEAAWHAARCAVLVALALSIRRPGRVRAQDGRALAFGLLANAERLRGNYRAAEKAWRRAHHYRDLGSADPLLKARLYDLEASLRRGQRRFAQAEKLLRRASTLYQRLGHQHLAARATVKLGTVLFWHGKLEEAIRATLHGGRGIDVGREPIVAMAAFHNLVGFIAEAGAPAMALAMLDDGDLLYLLSRNPIDCVRALWLRGRLYAALEEEKAALACLARVKQEFVARALPYEAALASLELAVLHLKANRLGEVKALAEEMYPVFVAEQIPREASAALLLFVEAARREAATVEAVERLLADLKGRLAPRGRQVPPGRFLT